MHDARKRAEDARVEDGERLILTVLVVARKIRLFRRELRNILRSEHSSLSY